MDSPFELILLLWKHGLVIPMTNFLVLIARVSFGNFGVAIIVFTLVMRGITWPLTQRQLHASRSMQGMQPRVQEIQKKHKDPRRRSEETMKLYREAGVSPLGCIWPMLVQFPIWIALYQSIRFTLGATPEALFNLSQRLYPWAYLRTSVPLENHFLWLDLGRPDGTLIMALLVGASTWIQQRLTTPMNANADPQQQSMNQTMLWMMPMLFAFFTLQFPSGLALYWVATNTVGIVLQYSARPENFTWRQIFTLSPTPAGVRPQLQEKPNREPEAAGDTEQAEEVVEQRPRRRRRRRGRGRRR